jgi:hypothetical protein
LASAWSDFASARAACAASSVGLGELQLVAVVLGQRRHRRLQQLPVRRFRGVTGLLQPLALGVELRLLPGRALQLALQPQAFLLALLQQLDRPLVGLVEVLGDAAGRQLVEPDARQLRQRLRRFGLQPFALLHGLAQARAGGGHRVVGGAATCSLSWHRPGCRCVSSPLRDHPAADGELVIGRATATAFVAERGAVDDAVVELVGPHRLVDVLRDADPEPAHRTRAAVLFAGDRQPQRVAVGADRFDDQVVVARTRWSIDSRQTPLCTLRPVAMRSS